MSAKDERLSYMVTDVAGERPDVAGKRCRVGDKLMLSAAQAEFELSRGVIVRTGLDEAKD